MDSSLVLSSVLLQLLSSRVEVVTKLLGGTESGRLTCNISDRNHHSAVYFGNNRAPNRTVFLVQASLFTVLHTLHAACMKPGLPQDAAMPGWPVWPRDRFFF